MDIKLEKGTLVMLKSGGPIMSVSDMRDQSDSIISCEWFRDGELKRDAFNLENLIIICP